MGERQARLERAVLYLSMFVMGGCGLAYEYTLSKLSSDLLGNSARQWAIIIGVMMFFMGVGADLQKYLRARNLIDKLIVAEIALGLIGGFGPVLLLYTYVAYLEAYVAVQYLLIAAIGLLIGIEIPLLMRINAGLPSPAAAPGGAAPQLSIQEGAALESADAAEDRALRFNLGGILKMDYIGALAGALAWTFVLPRLYTMTTGAFVLGLLNLLAAATALVYFRRRAAHPAALAAAVAAGVAALVVGLLAGDGWASAAEQRLYRDRVVQVETTPFQHIVVTRSAAGETALYLNGHLQLHSSDEHIYHENLVHPAMSIAPHPRRVLILGGGDGLALREVLRYGAVESVTLVDIDPAMTQLAAENPYLTALNEGSLRDARVRVADHDAVSQGAPLPPFEGGLAPATSRRDPAPAAESLPRIHVLNMDAVKLLESAPGLYDAIIVDFPDPNAADLSKLYTREVYGMVRAKLSAEGVMAVQSTSPSRAREAFLCIGRTLRAAGLAAVPYRDYVPSFGEWGWWIAVRDDRTDERTLRDALANLSPLEVPTRHITAETIGASLVFGKGALDTSETRVNTVTRDVVYEYYLAAWGRL
jgi:spermidine synthase